MKTGTAELLALMCLVLCSTTYGARKKPGKAKLVTQAQLNKAIKNCKKDVKDLIKNNTNGEDEPLAPLTKLKKDFYLAFRATAGVGMSAYYAYVNNDHDDGVTRRSVLPCGCLAVDGRAFCDRHYKSRILSYWPVFQSKMGKVRVSVYKRGKQKAFFDFRGQDSSVLSFFSEDRLQTTSYTDIDSDTTFNYVSLTGHERLPEVARRFFVNGQYANKCGNDKGWLLALDFGDRCPYTQTPPYPVFLYAGNKTSQTWGSGMVEQGDVLVVAVKFQKKYNPNNFIPDGKCVTPS